MIKIYQNNSEVVVSIETGLFGDDGSRTKYPTMIPCGNRQFAQLMTEHIKRLLFCRLQEIRKSAYEAGYRAGRSKTAKAVGFMGSLDGIQFEEE
jgi:hypothetical protein